MINLVSVYLIGSEVSFPPFNKNDLRNQHCDHQYEQHLSMH